MHTDDLITSPFVAASSRRKFLSPNRYRKLKTSVRSVRNVFTAKGKDPREA